MDYAVRWNAVLAMYDYVSMLASRSEALTAGRMNTTQSSRNAQRVDRLARLSLCRRQRVTRSRVRIVNCNTSTSLHLSSYTFPTTHSHFRLLDCPCYLPFLILRKKIPELLIPSSRVHHHARQKTHRGPFSNRLFFVRSETDSLRVSSTRSSGRIRRARG